MRIFICGISGRMGTVLCAEAIACGISITGGIDVKQSMFSTFSAAGQVNVDFDVIIDFSAPSAFLEVIKLVEKTRRPAVVCTTGLSDDDKEKIREVSRSSPVFYSENVSFGVGAMIALARRAATLLCKNYDIEIIESHHRNKLDSPFGTAKLIADEICKARPDLNAVFNRNGKRNKSEVGIASIRGGTICGQHEIVFAGDDEILTIKHEAFSRKVFARGAIEAAKFISDKTSGFYTYSDLYK